MNKHAFLNGLPELSGIIQYDSIWSLVMKKKEQGLTAWQLTMMALGTVIGGSFFLGSSVAIHAAGPSILIAYILGGIMVYFIVYALSEMTVANPD